MKIPIAKTTACLISLVVCLSLSTGCSTPFASSSNPFSHFTMSTHASTDLGKLGVAYQKVFPPGQPVLLRVFNNGGPKSVTVRLINTSTGQELVNQVAELSGGGAFGSVGLSETIMTLPAGNYSWIGQSSGSSAVWNFQVLE